MMTEKYVKDVAELWNKQNFSNKAWYRGVCIVDSEIIPMCELTPSRLMDFIKNFDKKKLVEAVLQFLKDIRTPGRFPEAVLISVTGFCVIWRTHLPDFKSYLLRNNYI